MWAWWWADYNENSVWVSVSQIGDEELEMWVQYRNDKGAEDAMI